MIIEGIEVRILKPNQRINGLIMPVGAIVTIEPDLAFLMIKNRRAEEISVIRRENPVNISEV